MSCGSCTSQGCSPAGCKGNGGCATGGCNKMNTYDWLQDMAEPSLYPSFDIVEIRFKGGRKGYYRNTENLNLVIGDRVVVAVGKASHHMGYVSLTGELVKLQLRKRKVENNDEIEAIKRIANEEDIEKGDKACDREGTTMYRAREIIQKHSLKMKLSDVEYQADNTKATFYYSAEQRVDFRELIKRLADEFKIRVEMRQISLRHEAGRLGGIGSCGRELCCSTWLSDFKTVSTGAARYQNLSINPAKLSGQCGRLKCCLNYELETYQEALKDIPKLEKPLQTSSGDAYLVKTDIFRKILWFSFEGESDWQPIKAEEVKRILELNKKGEKPDFVGVAKQVKVVEEDKSVNLESNLKALDKKHGRRKGKGKNRNRNNRNRNRGPRNKK